MKICKHHFSKMFLGRQRFSGNLIIWNKDLTLQHLYVPCMVPQAEPVLHCSQGCGWVAFLLGRNEFAHSLLLALSLSHTFVVSWLLLLRPCLTNILPLFSWNPDTCPFSPCCPFWSRASIHSSHWFSPPLATAHSLILCLVFSFTWTLTVL